MVHYSKIYTFSAQRITERMLTKLANKFRRITSNQIYLAEIDGLRFLAITAVTLFHIYGFFLKKTQVKFLDSPKDYSILDRFLLNADRGVPLFFVISGFILCLPFANHVIKNGKKIELKQYYLRRVTRLEPPYFIVMIGLFFTNLILRTNTVDTLLPSLLASLIYSHNLIFQHVPLLTVVAWSLEVEIQFYVLAPFLFKILFLPATYVRLILISLIVLFVTLQHLYPPSFPSLYGSVQFFLIGILISDFYVRGFAIAALQNKWMIPITFFLFLLIFLMPLLEETNYWGRLAQSLLFPFIIGFFCYSIFINNKLKKIFSYKFIPVIGGMCYTIYLVHYTVISMVGRFSINISFTDYFLPNFLLQVVLLVIPVLLLSGIFYLYVERPFMSKKWVDKLIGKKPKEEKTITTTTV